MHASIGLAHSKDTFDVAHGDRDATYNRGLPADICIETGDFVAIYLVEPWSTVSFRIDDVLLEEILVKWRLLGLHPLQCLIL